MTCTLILIRHAKSAWDAPAPSDHARPLNKRGRKSAKAIGQWLRDSQQIPDVVLSSSAQRTRETHDLLSLEAPVSFSERLYLASSDLMFQVLKEAQAPKVLMLGHNPGIAAFAHALVSEPPKHERFDDYPTAATLVVDFDIATWADLNWGGGTVRDFIVPRELTAD
ncbi:histidine phosphatase family protein [Aliisedimentitalea scapharcae]|uniref:Histidine phosphatase family protein n=1 Tax=Aliisedimentitalea scapharcae TaxID=1524259 RepID=A0ABZ2XVL9_9RHOB